jgi:hypothetical protein
MGWYAYFLPPPRSAGRFFSHPLMSDPQLLLRLCGAAYEAFGTPKGPCNRMDTLLEAWQVAVTGGCIVLSRAPASRMPLCRTVPCRPWGAPHDYAPAFVCVYELLGRLVL